MNGNAPRDRVIVGAVTTETTKDIVEAATGVALVAAGAAALPAAAIPSLVGAAWARFQQYRVDKWWKYVIRDAKSAAELEARVLDGLQHDDAYVVAGIVEGARAAAGAVDVAAVPIMAELSRRHFQDRDIPRWFYRGSLELLERLDALDIGALRTFVAEIDRVVGQSVTALAGPDAMEWQAFPTANAEDKAPFTPFSEPMRLFSTIKRTGLGHDSGGYGIGGSPLALVVERPVITWLHAALRAYPAG